MPPENNSPVAKADPSEFEFDAPPPENPRMRKRNLKVKPVGESDSSAVPQAAAQPQPAVYAQPAAATHSAPTGPVYVRPSGTAERTQPAPASGVLYYSNNPGTKKEDSMKSLPHQQAAPRPAPASQSAPHRPTAAASQPATARPTASTSFSSRATSAASMPQTTPTRSAPSASVGTGSSSAASYSGSRPAPTSSPAGTSTRAVSTTVASPSSSSRPAGVSDYRSNVERQTREQKSIGSILNLAVYVLIGLFLCAGLLAGYGAHDVYKQLHAQSTTVTELDSRYSAANQELTDKLTATEAGVQQIQTQLSHSQELLLRQQDLLGKMQTALDAQTQALHEERSTRAAETAIRAQETAALRSRLRSLEAKNDAYRP